MLNNLFLVINLITIQKKSSIIFNQNKNNFNKNIYIKIFTNI